MGLFDKMKEPVFLKESSNAIVQLEKLKSIEPMLTNEGVKKLKQEIRYVEYGIAGENNIAFELKNSHMPMYILHDIYLEDGDLSAQIDYLVFTKKLCFIIECKNLVGDIEIDNKGDFIRTMEFGGKKKKEGIYSPITQNQRHLELMKKIKLDSKTNILKRFMMGRYFEDFYKPIVVLANSKTILNAKFAKKEIKNQVIRADQLVSYIKETCKNSKEMEQSDNNLLLWAQSYLDFNIETEKDYTSKFNEYLIRSSDIPTVKVEETAKVEERIIDAIEVTTIHENVEESEIFKELKRFRLNKSHARRPVETRLPESGLHSDRPPQRAGRNPRSRTRHPQIHEVIDLLHIDGFKDVAALQHNMRRTSERFLLQPAR